MQYCIAGKIRGTKSFLVNKFWRFSTCGPHYYILHSFWCSKFGERSYFCQIRQTLHPPIFFAIQYMYVLLWLWLYFLVLFSLFRLMTQVSSEMCTTSGSQDGQTLVRKPLDNCNYNYNVDARNAKCLYISHLVSVNYYYIISTNFVWYDLRTSNTMKSWFSNYSTSLA